MSHITEEEKEKLLDLVKKTEAWIEEKEELQSAKSPFEEPAYDSADVPLQLKPVGLLFDRLMKKPRPPPPVIEKVYLVFNLSFYYYFFFHLEQYNYKWN
jgi:hypothetical protein